jgi:hypothetical protein
MKIKLLVLVALALLVTGCSKPSEIKELSEVAVVDQLPDGASDVDATALLEDAVAAHDLIANDKFWFNGYVRTNVDRRTVNAMLDGVADMGMQQYFVNGKIATQKYTFYRDGAESYLRRNDVWTKADAASNKQEFNPYVGFNAWIPAAKYAIRLPDATILGATCTVLQLKLTGTQWLATGSNSLFAEIQSNLTQPDVKTISDNTTVKTTLYIDQATSRVIQQSTWLVMPLPSGGSLDQEIFFRFYKFDDPAVTTQLDRIRSNIDSTLLN